MWTGSFSDIRWLCVPADLQILRRVSIKIPDDSFVEISMVILKFKSKNKELRTVKTILNMENKVRRLTLSVFKNGYEATVINRYNE